jgi:hypothetical protein
MTKEKKEQQETKYCKCHVILFEPGEQPLLQEERYTDIEPMTWCNDDGNWRYGERGLFR